VFKEDPQAAAAVVRFALNLIAIYAALSAPFIPDASAKMAEAMGTDGAWPEDVAAAFEALQPGHVFTVPDNLFDKITDEAREGWQETFAGGRG
jgi:methionyl-tRNA synthetase